MSKDTLENLGEWVKKPTTMLKVLNVLEQAKGPLWSGTICARAGVKPVDGNRALVRLVNKGMVVRKRHPRKTHGNIPKPGVFQKYYLYLLKEEYRPCHRK